MYYPTYPQPDSNYPGQSAPGPTPITLRNNQIPQPFGPWQPVQPVQPALRDNRIGVQGELAAAAYPVTANGFVVLWDNTAPVFYYKWADAQGNPFLEIYDYKRRGGEPVDQIQSPNYEARLKSIEARLSAVESNRVAGEKEDEA